MLQQLLGLPGELKAMLRSLAGKSRLGVETVFYFVVEFTLAILWILDDLLSVPAVKQNTDLVKINDNVDADIDKDKGNTQDVKMMSLSTDKTITVDNVTSNVEAAPKVVSYEKMTSKLITNNRISPEALANISRLIRPKDLLTNMARSEGPGDHVESEDAVPELPAIPQLQHLAKNRPKRNKKHAATKSMVLREHPTIGEMDDIAAGLEHF